MALEVRCISRVMPCLSLCFQTGRMPHCGAPYRMRRNKAVLVFHRSVNEKAVNFRDSRPFLYACGCVLFRPGRLLRVVQPRPHGGRLLWEHPFGRGCISGKGLMFSVKGRAGNLRCSDGGRLPVAAARRLEGSVCKHALSRGVCFRAISL